MKKKILVTLLTATMVAGLVGCGKGSTDGTESLKGSTSGTEVESVDTTEEVDSTDSETSKYGSPSEAYSYKDKVSDKTLTDKGWVQCEANGLSFYAPKECNTYTNTSGTNSICIVGLNEDFYNDVDETTATYGATDLYALCVIDASSTFKSDSESESTESTEEDDTRVVIKDGVFTKGETEKLIPTVLSDEDTSYKVMFDNDEMIMYQLDDSSAYLGFIYGTTNLVEIIFDPAAYEDIYEIKAQYGKQSVSDSTESTEESTEESSGLTLEDIEGRTGYLSGNYLDAYKEAVPKGEIGKLAFKKGYFMNDETEAALIMTIARTSKAVEN